MEDLYRKATIKIPFTIFSRNKIDKMHWAQKSKLKKAYQMFIRVSMKNLKIPSSQEKDKFKLTIISKRIRKCDFDNLVGGAKQLIDALSTERFIWDDAPAWLEIKQIKQIKSKEAKIVVSRLIL